MHNILRSLLIALLAILLPLVANAQVKATDIALLKTSMEVLQRRPRLLTHIWPRPPVPLVLQDIPTLTMPSLSIPQYH